MLPFTDMLKAVCLHDGNILNTTCHEVLKERLSNNITMNETIKWILDRGSNISRPDDLIDRFENNRKIDSPTKDVLIVLYSILMFIGALGNILVVASVNLYSTLCTGLFTLLSEKQLHGVIGRCTYLIFVAAVIKACGFPYHIALSVVRKPIMRTARNMFIVNLAVSDTLVCILGTPLTLMELLTKYWPLPKWPSLCKASGALQAISIFVSTISITAIALDRYQLIVYPTRQGIQNMGALITMLVIWIIALTLASPLFIFRTLKVHQVYGLDGIDCISFCIEDWPIQSGRAIYSIFSLIFQYVLPVLVVAMAHFQIHRRLRGRRRTSRKTPTILIAIVVTYVISWLPLNVFNLVADSSPEMILDENSMTITYAICHMFGMSSAVSNPLLYGWLNDNFRKEFLEILSCCKKKGHVHEDKRQNNRKLETELTALAQLEHTVTANTKTSQCSQIF